MLFFTVFFSIYLVGNFYILWRLSTLFGVGRGWFFYAIVIFLTFSYIAAAFLDSVFANGITRALCLLTVSWMGIGLLLLCTILIYEVINIFVNPPPFWSGVAVITFVACLTVIANINTRTLHIRTLDIPAPVNMDIVQLSDIHVGSVSEDYLRRVVEKTNSLSPDLVLITGDLMDPASRPRNAPFAPLNDLKAPVYFVTGNHERYTGVKKAMELLKDTKVIPLRNTVADFNGIQLAGIDDSADKKHVDKVIGGLNIDRSKFSILMYHHPEGLEAAANAGINLMLSGHTHNGQIFPFNFVIYLLHPRKKGLFEHGNCKLFVTTGTGFWGPPMRLGSNCEIVLIKLRKQQN